MWARKALGKMSPSGAWPARLLHVQCLHRGTSGSSKAAWMAARILPFTGAITKFNNGNQPSVKSITKYLLDKISPMLQKAFKISLLFLIFGGCMKWIKNRIWSSVKINKITRREICCLFSTVFKNTAISDIFQWTNTHPFLFVKVAQELLKAFHQISIRFSITWNWSALRDFNSRILKYFSQNTSKSQWLKQWPEYQGSQPCAHRMLSTTSVRTRFLLSFYIPLSTQEVHSASHPMEIWI